MRVTTRSELYLSATELRGTLDRIHLGKRELAEVLGVTDPAVDHWLTARRRVPPPVIKIIRLLEANREFVTWFKTVER